MKPILFAKNATDFTNNGLGALADCISCEVTEERNAVYECEITYPVGGMHYDEIYVDMIILAKPNETSNEQAFRIYNITKPINGIVTINCEHISYQTNNIPVLPFDGDEVSDTLMQLKTFSAVTNPFTLWTDKETIADFNLIAPKSLRACLCGESGSVVDVYGGELEFDNYTIKLHSQRGADNGVKIAYGKNLTDLKQEQCISDVATGICPYWSKDGETVYLDNAQTGTGHIIEFANSGNYAFERVIPVDLTDEFDEKPTQQSLYMSATKWADKNETSYSTPKVNLEISFVNLGDTDEYKQFKNLERVKMCDTVTVEFKKLGVSASAKVVKTVYDTLAEKYIKIELSSNGYPRASLSSIVVEQQKETEEAKSFLADAIERATKAITGNSGGCVVLDPPRNPQRLLIMDTDDVATATKVWQFNLEGLGYSSTGINGDYDTAITADGEIVGSFIQAGTISANALSANALSANNITAGQIKSKNGGVVFDLDNNYLKTGADGYETIVQHGEIFQKLNSAIVGGLVPVATTNGAVYQAIYTQSNGVAIGTMSGNNFGTIAEFKSNAINFVKSVETITVKQAGSFANGKTILYANGTAKFANGKIQMSASGGILMRGSNGTDVIDIASFLEGLDRRVTALENK